MPLDRDAAHWKEQCQSLSCKVDSLVKFLEEERSLRKTADFKSQSLEKRVLELEAQIASDKKCVDSAKQTEKDLNDIVLKLKDENDKLRNDKVEALNENRELQLKVVDVESRLRAAQQTNKEKAAEMDRIAHIAKKLEAQS